MSLLWTQAMAWYDDDRSDEDEEMLGSVRDTRPYAERRPELVKHISFVHDVPETAADRALNVVESGLGKGQHFGHPVDDYRMAGVRPRNAHNGDWWGKKISKGIYDARNWKEHGSVEAVPAQKLHAIQSWVRHTGVAHNLFHPGIKAPFQDGVEGDPDYDPDWDSDSHAEFEHGYGEPDPSRDYDTASTHVYEDEHGRQHVIDGHHRAAAHAILGKSVEANVLRSKRLPSGDLVHSWKSPEHF